jgi:hypothetical protein
LEQLEDRLAPARLAVTTTDQVALPDGGNPVTGRREVVFYESAVAGYQALLAGVAPGTDPVILNAGDDGLRAMAAFLAEHQGYDAIAVVAHGDAGALALGGATLDSATLAGYGPELATLSAALNPGGDLLLYGCDVAAGAQGRAFVQQLAQATGADVAAASHLVGTADLGGSWQLDVQTGPIEAGLPFATDQFRGVLDLALSTDPLPVGLVGTAYAGAVTASGGTGNTTLSVSNVSSAIPGLSIPAATGSATLNITGTPAAQGAVSFTVTAADAAGASASQSYTVTVNAVGDQTNLEGDTVALSVPFSASAGPLFFSATGLPTGLSVSAADGLTALVTGTIAAGAAANGNTFTTAITASDVPNGQPGTYQSTQTFSWTVAPRITVSPIDDQDNTEGDAASLQVTATSPDGAPLTYTADGLPDGLSIDPATGLISGYLSHQAAATGSYAVTVTATDGTYTGSQTFDWDVAENPPQLTVQADQSVLVGATVTLQASATDPSGITAVQWQVSFDGGDYQDLPDLTTLTPQYTFDTYGDYEFLVTVTNGLGESSTDGFTVTAGEVAPTALVTATGTDTAGTTATVAPNGTLQVAQGNAVTFTVALQSPDLQDTESVWVNWTGAADASFNQIDLSQVATNANSALSFKHRYGAPAQYAPVLRVTDDGGQSTDYAFTLVVLGVTPDRHRRDVLDPPGPHAPHLGADRGQQPAVHQRDRGPRGAPGVLLLGDRHDQPAQCAGRAVHPDRRPHPGPA